MDLVLVMLTVWVTTVEFTGVLGPVLQAVEDVPPEGAPAVREEAAVQVVVEVAGVAAVAAAVVVDVVVVVVDVVVAVVVADTVELLLEPFHFVSSFMIP
jgi:hypothetical protein